MSQFDSAVGRNRPGCSFFKEKLNYQIYLFSFGMDEAMIGVKGGGVSMDAVFGLVPMLILSVIAVVLILAYFFFHRWAK